MAAGEALSWTAHPFRRRRGRGWAGLAAAATALGLVHLWARSLALTLLGGVLLAVSLWPFYFPVRWRLSETEITADFGAWRRRWPWERFKGFVALGDGAVLTPFARPHALERWRTLWLPCPERADDLHAWLAQRLPRRGGEGNGP